jgi:hypothetical protein
MSDAQLPEDVLALLAAEREREPLPADVVDAKLAAFHAALSSPSSGGAPGGAPPDAASGSPAPTKLATKLAGYTAAVALGALVGFGSAKLLASAPEPIPAPAPSARSVIIAPPASVAPVVTPPVAVPEPSRAAPPVSAPPLPQAPAPSTLHAERVLLERARSAILRRDADAALAAVALHAKRFPHGQLAEEREALRTQAERLRSEP